MIFLENLTPWTLVVKSVNFLKILQQNIIFWINKKGFLRAIRIFPQK